MIETKITRKVEGKYSYFYRDTIKDSDWGTPQEMVVCLDGEEVSLRDLFNNIEKDTHIKITIETE